MNTSPKRSAAPDVGQGGARTLFPTNNRKQLVVSDETQVNCYPRNRSGKLINSSWKRERYHRLNTPFLRGEDPSPAAEELMRIRGRRLAGEPAAGWRCLGDRS